MKLEQRKIEDYPKMRVWDGDRNETYPKRVCAILEEYCIDVDGELWENFEPIPELSDEIWSWEKSVVWYNKQKNIVFRINDEITIFSNMPNIGTYDNHGVRWNRLNDDGTYKFPEWRTFCDKDCLEE